MPTYRITILDENWEEVKKNINADLEEKLKLNEKIKNSKVVKIFNKAYKQLFKVDFTIEMSWKWISDKVCIHTVFSTAMIEEEVYDKVELGLAELGKVRIERINEKGEVEKVLVNG